MTLAARCHHAPPHCGERPSGYDKAVTQGQVSDHPSKATKYIKGVSGWTRLSATSRGENVAAKIKHGQHLIVISNDMLAIPVNSSPKHALSRGRKTCVVAAGLFRCFQSVFVSAKYLQRIAA